MVVTNWSYSKLPACKVINKELIKYTKSVMEVILFCRKVLGTQETEVSMWVARVHGSRSSQERCLWNSSGHLECWSRSLQNAGREDTL